MSHHHTPRFRLTLQAVRWLAGILLIVAAVPGTASAQTRLGGHFGCVIPLVTNAQGQTVTVGDDFVIGFPTGVTVKKNERVAFDLEFVPVIQNEPRGVALTLHPGVIFSAPHHMAAGLRMAFDVNGASWGFTPLLNRALVVNKSSVLFAELVAPIRFQQDVHKENFTSVGLGVHVGVGF
jgi:hypothetical protein